MFKFLFCLTILAAVSLPVYIRESGNLAVANRKASVQELKIRVDALKYLGDHNYNPMPTPSPSPETGRF